MEQESIDNQNSQCPLVVDLDGTLIRTDMLQESAFGLLRLNLFYIFLLPFWLLQGKAHMKQMIADRVDMRVDLLPWHEGLLEYLRAEHSRGRRLILATASNQRYAQEVAEQLGIFDAVIGSTATENLSGARKLEKIEAVLKGGAFEYAGNATVDLMVWKKAEAAVLVNPGPVVKRRATALGNVKHIFEEKRSLLGNLVRAMRPHQWLKNLLLFIPLIASQQLDDFDQVFNAFLGFVAFCLCASSVYLLNDLLDLDSDRQHPRKRNRPFAAGKLPISYGVIAKVALLLAALLLTLFLPPMFLLVLVAYYLLTTAYSLWLKRAALVDGLVLAGLYSMRLVAGGAATEVAPSFWLLAFSIFIFLSLAFIKRYSELLLLHESDDAKLAGRGYKQVDMETLALFGTASGYISVLVLAFYINSDGVNELYARPEALWLLCPMMLYWISRMWLLTRRGEMHDDPVVFTIRDPRTWLLAVFASISLGVAVFWSWVVNALLMV
jgi:4-hydroxybenzoate polyprenyltransferase/phosphoserine phosphatase